MDIVQKHVLHAIGMKLYGRAPRSFCFDENVQSMIMACLQKLRDGEKLASMYYRVSNNH